MGYNRAAEQLAFWKSVLRPTMDEFLLAAMNLAKAEHLMVLNFLTGQPEKINPTVNDTNMALTVFSQASKQLSQIRPHEDKEHLADLSILLRQGLAIKKLCQCSAFLEKEEMTLIESVIICKAQVLVNTVLLSQALVGVREARLVQALDPPQDFNQAMLAVSLEDPVIEIANEARRVADQSVQQFLSVVENWSKSNHWLSRDWVTCIGNYLHFPNLENQWQQINGLF